MQPSMLGTGNTYDLAGRATVITGGAGGVGRAVCAAFAEAGAQVVIVERESARPAAEELVAGLNAAGRRAQFVAADLMDEASVQTMVQRVRREAGRLDVLVNLVGGFAAGQPITELELATWQHMQDLNVRTAFLVSKHAGRVMSEQGGGVILNMSARGARSGRKNAAAYAVAKAAIITLTEVQAEELRDAGVRVNCLLPSIVDTPANRAAMPAADFGRWPKAEEVARVLVFLASDDARLISGAAIPVYGRA